MTTIKTKWSEPEKQKIEQFLQHSKAILATGDYTIEPKEKNKIFERKYPLKDCDKKNILKSLSTDDCIGFEPNDNPRYSDSTVFKFIKDVKIPVYGEQQTVRLYIKQYITDVNKYEVIIVISFHEEGMHSD